jgi:hypothetical protein
VLMTENKKITVGHLFKSCKKIIIYSSIENSEVILAFELNNVGLKELSSFV